jgi:hypothetical protein
MGPNKGVESTQKIMSENENFVHAVETNLLIKSKKKCQEKSVKLSPRNS